MLDRIPATAGIIDLASGEALDRGALAAAVAARAAALGAAGAGPRSLLAMCHRSGTVLLADLLAAWRLGAAGLVLAPGLTPPERARIVAWAGPVCWIGEREQPGVAWLPPRLDTSWRAAPAGLRDDPASADDPALVLLTSGTTGRPKGVVLSHRALGARLDANLGRIGHEDLARSLALLPLHFGHGLIGNSLTPLRAGGTLLLWPEPGVDGLARLGEIIDANAVTFLSSVPSMWRVVLRLAAPPRGRSLRRVHVGSEPLSSELWRAICGWAGTERVFDMYGMTEAANWVAGASAAETGAAGGSVGRPWSGTWRVMREDGSLSEHGRGEIVLRDPAMMAGYLDDPAATAAAFVDGWLRTGDIGEIDGAGRLRLVGRAKHLINRGGIKVSAEEIDVLLEQHPDVAEACAFPAADAISGETVAAAVVLRDGAAVRPAELKAWCAERVRHEAVPARIFFMAALPRSDRGKLRREEIGRLALEQQGQPA